MEICSCNHPEIIHNERECPLCKMRRLTEEALDYCNNIKGNLGDDIDIVSHDLNYAIINLEMALE